MSYFKIPRGLQAGGERPGALQPRDDVLPQPAMFRMSFASSPHSWHHQNTGFSFALYSRIHLASFASRSHLSPQTPPHFAKPPSGRLSQVLCNGVTMYFPSADYLLECMQIAVKAKYRSIGYMYIYIYICIHILVRHVNISLSLSLYIYIYIYIYI